MKCCCTAIFVACRTGKLNFPYKSRIKTIVYPGTGRDIGAIPRANRIQSIDAGEKIGRKIGRWNLDAWINYVSISHNACIFSISSRSLDLVFLVVWRNRLGREPKSIVVASRPTENVCFGVLPIGRRGEFSREIHCFLHSSFSDIPRLSARCEEWNELTNACLARENGK